MKADPDRVEARVPWGDGPVASRLLALLFVALALGNAIVSAAPIREVVGFAVLGLAWGLVMWRFDFWWGNRQAVRMVDSRPFTEVRRYAPPLALEFVATLLVFKMTSDSSWAVFFLTTFAVQQALVSPRWYQRRAARRTVKLRGTPLSAEVAHLTFGTLSTHDSIPVLGESKNGNEPPTMLPANGSDDVDGPSW